MPPDLGTRPSAREAPPCFSVQEFLDAAPRLIIGRTARDAQRLHFVDGIRNVARCVDHGIPIKAALVSKTLLRSPAGREVARSLTSRSIPTLRVAPEVFRSVSTTAQASGLAAIVHQHHTNRLPPSPRGVWLGVGLIRSPGNLGTLMRSAAAVGATGLICIGDATDPFNPGAVRASMGAIFALRIVRTEASELARWITDHDVLAIAADPAARQTFDSIRYRPPCLIVLGEERQGLSLEQRAMCAQKVRIPMCRGTDSLNVGVAGTLLLYASRPARPHG